MSTEEEAMEKHTFLIKTILQMQKIVDKGVLYRMKATFSFFIFAFILWIVSMNNPFSLMCSGLGIGIAGCLFFLFGMINMFDNELKLLTCLKEGASLEQENIDGNFSQTCINGLLVNNSSAKFFVEWALPVFFVLIISGGMSIYGATLLGMKIGIALAILNILLFAISLFFLNKMLKTRKRFLKD